MSFTRIVTIEDSDQIIKVIYHPGMKKMAIKFKNGATYSYEGVPTEIFGGLVSAESVGKYFHANIKEVYSGKKLT